MKTRVASFLVGGLAALSLAMGVGVGAATVLPELTSPSSPSRAAGLRRMDLGIEASRAEATPDRPSSLTTQALVPGRTAAPAGLVSPAGWSYESDVVSRKLGATAATAGDVNGDGYGDVVALGESGSNMALYLFLGGPTGPTLAPGFPVTNLPGAGAGYAACGVGDVNNDGYGDVGVGLAQGAGTIGSGRFRVYYGSASGLLLTGFFEQFAAAGGAYAAVVKPAGDVNGDGFDDVLVGSPTSPPSLFYCGGAGADGAVEIYYGSAAGMNYGNRQIAFACQWSAAGANFARAISAAGDVNGDGYDDVVLGGDGSGTNSGSVWVEYGSASGLPTLGATLNLSAGTRIDGFSMFSGFGRAVFAAGDVNSDGYADIAVGAPGEDTYGIDAGLAWVFPGSAAGPNSASPLWFEASGAGTQFGQYLCSAGDHNGDGRPDLLVGQNSQLHVVTSHASGMLITQSFSYAPGSVICETAGDVNGDGFSDLVVGDQGYTNGESLEGRLLIHYGAGDPPVTSASWEITTSLDNPNLGWSVASVGDVNGDGFDDFAVGAPTWDLFGGGPDNGLVLLYYGALGGPSTSYSWFYYGATSDQVGISVAAAGDVNGDGYGDLVIGAHQPSGGSGQALVFYGHSTGPSLSPDRVLNGPSSGSQFGASVACAGDVNGDGYADVVVGAPNDEDPVSPLSNEGRAFLYLGGAGGLATSSSWSDRGGQQDAHFGNTVASIGDANGDGFSDVAVAMPDWDKPSGPFFLVDTGRIKLYHGQFSGVPLAFQGSLDGPTNGRLGASMAGAGDVNGDGYSDLVAGAPSWNNQGWAAVYGGSASGIAPGGLWSQGGGEAFGGYGSAVAGAGDVNGDGLSDILVGAVFQDVGGAQDRGHAALYLGPLPGGATPAWDVYGPSSFANLGHSLANAGDVDGDGWSDLLFGMPGYTNVVSRQGLCRLYRGARGSAVFQRSLAFRPLTSRFVQPLGLTDPNLVALGMTGRSAAGRTRVKMEWRVRPSVGLGAPTLTGVTNYLQTGAPGSNGSVTGPLVYENRLVNGIPYSWQLRTRSRSIYFPGTPWFSPARSGAREVDMRAPGTWVDVTAEPVVAELSLASVHPNPMRASSLVEFSLAREGAVSLAVVDVQGRRVRELVRGTRPAGANRASWDGRDEAGRAAAPGVYFVRLEAEGRTLSRKLALIR